MATFGSNPLSIEYVANTGFGKFKAIFNPVANELRVQVKVFWEFIDEEGGTDWTPFLQNQYIQQVSNCIPRAWNEKYSFRCKKEDFAHYRANVHFELVPRTDDDHHFPFKISSRPEGLSYLHNDGYVKLFANDYRTSNEKGRPAIPGMSAAGVLMSEERRLRPFVENASVITVDRPMANNAQDNWRITDANSTRTLDHLARALTQTNANPPRFTITVRATSGKSNKAAAVCRSVVNYLTTRGVDLSTYPIIEEPTTSASKWFGTKNKRTHTVTISMDDDIARAWQNYEYNYRVCDHEFGHCLGLPDEYTLYPKGGPLEHAHARWRELCISLNIEPNPYAQEGRNVFNESIMSAGWRVDPCHLVTIWDALGKLTEDHGVRALDWSIHSA